MSAGPNAHRRDPRARFALVTLGSMLLGSLVAGSLCFVPLFLAFSRTPEPGFEQARIAGEILALDRHLWKLAIGIAIAIVPPATILYRRVTGPLVRFRRTFDALASGTLPAGFRIRSGDYLHREADSLHAMLQGLRERVEQIRETHTALRDALHRAADRPARHGDPSEAVRELARLDKALADAISELLVEDPR